MCSTDGSLSEAEVSEAEVSEAEVSEAEVSEGVLLITFGDNPQDCSSAKDDDP